VAVFDADAADKVEKEKLAIDKAEAASEARKSVDVIWYDQVCQVCILHNSYLTLPTRILLRQSYLPGKE
jgi:hypothetical protein